MPGGVLPIRGEIAAVDLVAAGRRKDRAYQGNETRQLALDLGFTPVVQQRP